MTQAEQLERWVAGESVHCPDACVPDFSCCQPALLAAREVREAFAEAFRLGDNGACLRFLGAFFNAAVEHEYGNDGVRVHVVVEPGGES